MKPSNGDRYDKCSDFAGNRALSAFLLNMLILARASCSFLSPISSSIAQSMDSGGTDNFILISQLKEEVMSLKRLLQQRDQTILDKDRKVRAPTLTIQSCITVSRVYLLNMLLFFKFPSSSRSSKQISSTRSLT